MTGHTKPIKGPLFNVMVWPDVLRVHMIPKVASAAINYAFSPRQFAFERTVAAPNTPGHEFRFAFVRHPADRLVSAWAFFCNTPTDDEFCGTPNLATLGYSHGMSLEAFIEIALDRHNLDPHTAMQVHRIGDQPFDLLLPLSSIAEVWPVLHREFPKCLKPMGERVHQSKRDKIVASASMLARIEDEFAADVALYEIAAHWPTPPEQAIAAWKGRQSPATLTLL